MVAEKDRCWLKVVVVRGWYVWMRGVIGENLVDVADRRKLLLCVSSVRRRTRDADMQRDSRRGAVYMM